MAGGNPRTHQRALNLEREKPLHKVINVLVVGDILGTSGVEITTKMLRSFCQKYDVHFCIANGENVTDGKGITEGDARRLFSLGVNVITSGNHLWEKFQIRPYLAQEKNLLRPLNYPRENPGFGYTVNEIPELGKVGVINLQGRSFMYPIDCPFKTADWAISKIQSETKVIVVDFHAEATAEKMALGWYLDGRVSAVIGTHTHIPTSDARILPNGTAYLTDVGMTGPYDSVIGMRKEQAIKRIIHQTPYKFEQAVEGVKFCGVFIAVDSDTGKAQRIEHIIFPEF
jgi:metallophosphoesterase (TIGR00282 family)